MFFSITNFCTLTKVKLIICVINDFRLAFSNYFISVGLLFLYRPTIVFLACFSYSPLFCENCYLT